jgi:ribosomal protein S18 acetylase RimI-like enzyme
MMWPGSRRAPDMHAPGYPPLRLVRLTSPDSGAMVQPLFREYVRWIADRIAVDFRVRLDNHTIERHHATFQLEMPHLLGSRGRLLLASRGNEFVGVGALKPVDATTAEIKRIYVRPETRGQGIGRTLLEQLVEDARAEGYHVVRLETLVFMEEAHALYRSLGFVETEEFEPSEAAKVGLERATFYMELALQQHPQHEM